MSKTLLAVLLMSGMAVATVGVAGCSNDNGPGQKVGQKVDQMTGNEGPAQKAGEKADKAGKDVSNGAKNMYNDTKNAVSGDKD